MNFDIIGDVHGHADKLERLLAKLGYERRSGVWRHPERSAIFVGDFIDRGPGQLRTLRLVRAMIEAGFAQAVMGNHEFNAIGWATPDPEGDTSHLRPRHGAKGAKNAHQHRAFLDEVGLDTQAHRSWVEWMLELPLWIETPEFRVVHACWDPAKGDIARRFLGESARLTPETVLLAYTPGHPLREAVDVLLKGPEAELPPGFTFTDKDGHERSAIRTRWWDAHAATYRDACIGPGGGEIPDLPLAAAARIPEPDRLTFIGHYWLEPDQPPAPLAPKVVCVDYSAANGGPLMAYRDDGRPARRELFVSACAEPARL